VFLNSSLREIFIKCETHFINGNTASVQKLHRVKEQKFTFSCVVIVLSEIGCSYCSLMKIQEVFLDFLDIKDEDGKLIRTYVTSPVKMPLYPRRLKYLSNLIYQCFLSNTNTQKRTETYTKIIAQLKTQAALKNFDLTLLIIEITEV
jgi:hypothetical protein